MTLEAPPTLDIAVHLEEDPAPTMGVLVRGGIRVRVGGQRVNSYEHEENYPSIHEWYPEFVGEHLLLDLGDLFEFAVDVVDDELALYEPRRVYLRETSDAFVCERIGVQHVRIALQKAEGFGAETILPTPAAACGFAVPVEAFAAELVSCGEEVKRALDRFGLLDDADVRTFLEKHENLLAAVGPD